MKAKEWLGGRITCVNEKGVCPDAKKCCVTLDNGVFNVCEFLVLHVRIKKW